MGFQYLVGKTYEIQEVVYMQKASKAQIKKIIELLRTRKKRSEEGLFIAEGQKIVNDTLCKGHRIDSVYVSSKVMTSPSIKKLLALSEEKKVLAYRVPAAEFEKLSSLRSSQGILAAVEKPLTNFHEDIKDLGSLAVLCDGVQDPGNLGAIIRASVAFGVSSILLTGETADVYNPKVVRGSIGTVVDLLAYECSLAEIDMIKASGYRLLGATAKCGKSRSIEDISLGRQLIVLALGSEGKGLSREITERVDEFFHIPIDKRVESLNVSCAASVALYALKKT